MKNDFEQKFRYEDIVNLPHPVSRNHPRMSMEKRAAQFSPFAAISGYEDACAEVRRYTEKEMEISEDQIEEINHILNDISMVIEKKPYVFLTYFQKDQRKQGGQYIEKKGRIVEINQEKGILIFEDGEKIEIEKLVSIALT